MFTGTCLALQPCPAASPLDGALQKHLKGRRQKPPVALQDPPTGHQKNPGFDHCAGPRASRQEGMGHPGPSVGESRVGAVGWPPMGKGWAAAAARWKGAGAGSGWDGAVLRQQSSPGATTELPALALGMLGRFPSTSAASLKPMVLPCFPPPLSPRLRTSRRISFGFVSSLTPGFPLILPASARQHTRLFLPSGGSGTMASE